MKAINKEQVTSKAGKPYWKLTLDDGRKCSMWEGGESVPLETELDNTYSVVENNGYLNLKSKLQPPTFVQQRRAGSGIAQAQEVKRTDIRNAQENKEFGIKVSSTMNKAVDLAIAELGGNRARIEYEDRIKYWREWLWFEWEKHTDYPPFK